MRSAPAATGLSRRCRGVHSPNPNRALAAVRIPACLPSGLRARAYYHCRRVLFLSASSRCSGSSQRHAVRLLFFFFSLCVLQQFIRKLKAALLRIPDECTVKFCKSRRLLESAQNSYRFRFPVLRKAARFSVYLLPSLLSACGLPFRVYWRLRLPERTVAQGQDWEAS